ncbi:MAG: beta-lactamase family protein [Lachnospiraceae bacterium]|nr:beta-lactamase family protein [Lachnospiraceae bacterium]
MKKAIMGTMAILLGAAAVAGGAGAMQGNAADTIVREAPAPAQDGAAPQDAEGERVYCLASVSKVYATAAVMQLVDRGLVDLDVPVTEYIPDFKMADPRYKDITVRMLMNHTSGILGTTLLNESLYAEHDVDAEGVLLENLSKQRLKADPGEYAAYCNDGFGLLQIIVRNVSGMSFTDYITNELAASIGLSHTGTAENADRLGDLVPIYVGGLPNDYEYCMDFGSGGICATASDTALFGSSFFTGSNSLISSGLSDEMKECWTDSDDAYLDGCGLGWDYVESLKYEREGVQVVGKGGDVGTMHSHLMVAPDEKISVAVLSSGGGSQLCGLMCEALLDAALEEQGKSVRDLEPGEIHITDAMPEEIKQYAGYYSFNDSTAIGLAKLSFPDQGTMLVEVATFDGRISQTCFRYADCGGFVEVSESGVPRKDQRVLYFKEQEDGGVYIASEQYAEKAEMGSYMDKQYIAERVEANPLSEKVQAAWEARCAHPMAVCNNRYSSTVYDAPFVFMKMPEELPGYVLIGTGLGSRLLKIKDEQTAVAFQTLPCTSSRDQIDLHVTKEGTVEATFGNECVSLAAVPEFTSDIKEIPLTSDRASWYRVSEEMAYEVIMADCPDDVVIYAYNKFFEPVYTTHYIDAGEEINLPVGGYIVFLGQSGQSVKIN